MVKRSIHYQTGKRELAGAEFCILPRKKKNLLLKFLYFGKDSTVTLQAGYKVQLHRIGQRAPEAKGAEQYIHVGKIESTGSQLTDTENNEVR